MRVTTTTLSQEILGIVKENNVLLKELVASQAKPEKKVSAKSKVSSKAKSSKKTSDSEWNESAYRKAVKAYGVASKNGGCYRFCRELFVSYGKGEITEAELKKQFKALDKPEWF